MPLYAVGDSNFLAFCLKNRTSFQLISIDQAKTKPHALFVHLSQLELFDQGTTDGARLRQILSDHMQVVRYNNNFMIVFDYSHEGLSFDERFGSKLIYIHKICQELNISSSRVLLIHHNSELLRSRSYVNWCGRSGLIPFAMLYCQWWLMEQSVDLLHRYGEKQIYDRHRNNMISAIMNIESPKTHRFLSYNYYPRPHRVVWLLTLLERNLLRFGKVSFPGFSIPEDNTDFYQDALINLNYWRRGRDLKKWLPTLADISPLIVDGSAQPTKMSLAHKFSDEPYLSTWFSVVTETDFSNGIHTRRITEKFLKSTIHFHPFLMLAEPGTISTFEGLGFEHFGPFFESDYDAIIDPEARFNAVTDMTENICNMSILDIRQQLVNILDSLEHNFYHSVYGLGEELKIICELPIVEFLTSRLYDNAIIPPYPEAFELRDGLVGEIFAPNDSYVFEDVIELGVIYGPERFRSRANIYFMNIRDDRSDGNHCVIFRTSFDTSLGFDINFWARSASAHRLLIQIKEPMTEHFAAIFNFGLGVMTSTENISIESQVCADVVYRGDDWFSFRFWGHIGMSEEKLDIVLYLGSQNFSYQSEDRMELQLGDIGLSDLRGE